MMKYIRVFKILNEQRNLKNDANSAQGIVSAM